MGGGPPLVVNRPQESEGYLKFFSCGIGGRDTTHHDEPHEGKDDDNANTDGSFLVHGMLLEFSDEGKGTGSDREPTLKNVP